MEADDDRLRDLCSRHIPQMREHQRMLEEYQSQLGAEPGTGKNILGAVLGAAGPLLLNSKLHRPDTIHERR